MSKPQASWMAEAAMHRILRRTLPAQRHEVLGALSALKLQLAVARRRAETGTAWTAAERLADVQGYAEQQAAAQLALVQLRLWDGALRQQRPLPAVLHECAQWVQQAAVLRGHRLLPVVPLEDEAPLPDVDVPLAHHLLLGWLYTAFDTVETPTDWTVSVQLNAQGGALVLRGQRREAGDALPPPLPPAAAALGMPAALLDRSLLEALAAWAAGAGLRWSVRGEDPADPAGLALIWQHG